jgi:hypothetical protein
MNPNEPQPTEPTPVAPEIQTNPTAPIGAGSTSTSTPEPKKSNKNLIIIASVVATVLLLALIGAFVYSAMNTVSKQDYKDAAVQFNVVAKEGSKLGGTISRLTASASSSSEEGFNASLKDVENSIETIAAENEKLGDLKAVRTGEGKELYTAFDNKLTAYLAHAKDLHASVEVVRPALVSCAKVPQTTDNATRLAVLKVCSTDMKAVNDVPNEQFQTFINALKDGYPKYATTYESMLALTQPNGSQREQYRMLRDEMTVVQKSISDAGKAFSDSVKKQDADMSVKTSADALGDFLTKQQR